MNAAIRAAVLGPRSYCSNTQTALFHSTPVLERKRRTFWESKSNSNAYNKRFRRRRAKQDLLRNVNVFAEHLFGGWDDEFSEDDPSSRKHASWFKNQYGKGSKMNRGGKHGPQSWGKRHFDFCEDGEEYEIDYIFRSAFGGSRSFFCSFIHEEEEPPWRHSSRYSSYFRRSWKSRYRQEEDDEEDGYSSTESIDPDSSQASHRLALGLSPSGPLLLEDVKNAYRACALKWHPDRHLGPAKAVAEEKFKLCSAAYQSLCDKLSIN
ncbi:PREDICTED: uncharacterized protein LOC104802604 [Tarenaya hassleriana]|uniref:uncharacterized protein LOC104802604 n=1 Tax=Tarenaya hassleriana TaxID=28532 RepID=UPI00053C8C1D|nr:PREDICTED: uncharacterized protein LOC104802604 [Tarenaya hassleriana]XP_010524590.1 PREDICTED: uncharacterized protein LOC104802604 [Tarenaya hassleriana]